MEIPWAELFPALGDLQRTAIELRPQMDAGIAPNASQLGGPVLWPRQLDWPQRPEGDPFIPLLQLRRVDFPEIPFPAGRDLLQILWHPQFTERRPIGFLAPATRVYWWAESDMAEAQPAKPVNNSANPGLLPRACRLTPRRRADLPEFIELPAYLQAALAERDLIGAYAESRACSRESKLLGHAAWMRDPIQLRCSWCGRLMIHFLSLVSDMTTGLDFHNGGTGHFLMCAACERRPVTLLVESQ